jgi:uncharacterized phage-associated protein
MVYPVTDVADWFIARTNSDEEFGENITNLKLQKLIYYAQGFNLAWYGEPLFDEPIEAWMHGPVVRSLYDRYQSYKSNPIPTREDFDPSIFDDRTANLLEEVYGTYGQFSAWGLRNLTHEEAPWKETPNLGVISREKMAQYFAESLTRA